MPRPSMPLAVLALLLLAPAAAAQSPLDAVDLPGGVLDAPEPQQDLQATGTADDLLPEDEPQDPEATGNAVAPSGASLIPWTLPVLAVGALGLLVARSLVGVRRDERSPGTGEAPTPEPAADPDDHATRDAKAALEAGASSTMVLEMLDRAGVPGILELGKAAAGRAAYDEAIRWFETATAVQPRLPVAHTCLGMCLMGLERYEEAAESFLMSLELDPDDGAVRYHLAKALVRQGHLGEAMDALTPLLRQLPEVRDAARQEPAFAELRDHPRFLDLLDDL